MRSRFFGASSFDEPGDEDSPMDMSGFIGSTTVEQQPIVVERKRAIREAPAQTLPFSGGDSGVGNAGPRSVPPPQPQMRNIGYAPSLVNSAADNTGSPWNPLWASDDTLGPKHLPVILKCAGLAGVFGGGVYSAGSRSIAGMGGKMMVAGTAAYLHPALGLGQGQIANWMGDRAKWQVYGSSILVNGIGGYVFYKIITR